jgi:hypothetical protein
VVLKQFNVDCHVTRNGFPHLSLSLIEESGNLLYLCKYLSDLDIVRNELSRKIEKLTVDG